MDICNGSGHSGGGDIVDCRVTTRADAIDGSDTEVVSRTVHQASHGCLCISRSAVCPVGPDARFAAEFVLDVVVGDSRAVISPGCIPIEGDFSRRSCSQQICRRTGYSSQKYIINLIIVAPAIGVLCGHTEIIGFTGCQLGNRCEGIRRSIVLPIRPDAGFTAQLILDVVIINWVATVIGRTPG